MTRYDLELELLLEMGLRFDLHAFSYASFPSIQLSSHAN
jgi:hypothetical protein